MAKNDISITEGVGSFSAPQISNAGQQLMSGIHSSLSRLSDQSVNDYVEAEKQTSINKGQLEGVEAAEKGIALDQKKDNNYYNRAYNQSAKQSYFNMLGIKATQALQDARSKYPADESNFNEVANNTIEGITSTMSQVDPAAAQLFKAKTSLQQSQISDGVRSNQIRNMRDEQLAQVNEISQNQFNEASRNAQTLFSGTDLEKAKAVTSIASNEQYFQHVLTQVGPDGEPLLSRSQIQSISQKYTQNLYASAIKSHIEQSKDPSKILDAINNNTYTIPKMVDEDGKQVQKEVPIRDILTQQNYDNIRSSAASEVSYRQRLASSLNRQLSKRVNSQVSSSISQYENYGQSSTSVNMNDLKAVGGDDAVNTYEARKNEAIAQHNRMQEMLMASPAEIGESMANLQKQVENFDQSKSDLPYSDLEKHLQATVNALKVRNAAIKKDPSEYVQNNSILVQQAAKHVTDLQSKVQQNPELAQDPSYQKAYKVSFEHMLETEQSEQLHLGLLPSQTRVLSKDHATTVAQDMSSVKNPEQLYQMTQQYQVQYGKYSGKVFKELVKAGADSNIGVLGTMPEGQAARDLGNAIISGGEKGLKSVYSSSFKQSDLDDEIKNQMEDFKNSLPPGNQSTLNSYSNAVKTLALYYASQGTDSTSDAAKKAYSAIIGNNVNYSGTVRIPTEVDADQVANGIANIGSIIENNHSSLSNVPNYFRKDLNGDPEERRKEYLASIVSHGTPYTNSDNSGINIMDTFGRPVMVKTGHGSMIPLSISWKELSKSSPPSSYLSSSFLPAPFALLMNKEDDQ